MKSDVILRIHAPFLFGENEGGRDWWTSNNSRKRLYVALIVINTSPSPLENKGFMRQRIYQFQNDAHSVERAEKLH